MAEQQQMPSPPEANIAPERIEAAEERWQACPLRDCKRNPELLYQDFYLRDIRTNRLMCSACAVRAEIGYLAREVAKASDDRFFTGTNRDYIITFFSIMGMSAVVNLVAMFIPFFYFALLIGGAAGAVVGGVARRLTGRRVGRQSAPIAIAGCITGMALAPLLQGLFYGTLEIYFLVPSYYFSSLLNINLILCTGAMAAAIYGIFLRRI